MKIEAGKYYRDREGTTIGPMVQSVFKLFPWTTALGMHHWMDNGRFFVNREFKWDLVEEVDISQVNDKSKEEMMFDTSLHKVEEGVEHLRIVGTTDEIMNVITIGPNRLALVYHDDEVESVTIRLRRPLVKRLLPHLQAWLDTESLQVKGE